MAEKGLNLKIVLPALSSKESVFKKIKRNDQGQKTNLNKVLKK